MVFYAQSTSANTNENTKKPKMQEAEQDHIKKQMPYKSRIATLLKRTIPEKMPCKLLKTGRQTRKDDEKKKVLIKAKSERWKNETTNRKKTREEEEEDQKHKRNALQTRNTTNKDELSTPHANFDLYMGTFSYVHQPGLYM